jgi:phosphoglycolate phosphatase-like HAD superfamily hydrolase
MFSSHALIGPIEVSPGFSAPKQISHVLFDFDGTLSLLRSGWPEVMVQMFLEMFPRRNDDTESALRSMLYDDIMRLNGKQTIYQMIRFAERVSERGSVPRESGWYKDEYARRLHQKIDGRIQSIQDGSASASDFLVAGASEFLEYLRARGFTLYLASGTDEAFVIREAKLLGLTEYFGTNFYAAKDHTFSKRAVIDQMLLDHSIAGGSLLSFGDGYVELVETKAVGGTAVAVACDEEHNGSGRIDMAKRELLVNSGADLVIPDYRDGIALMESICGARS